MLTRIWRKSTSPISFMETTWDIIGNCKILLLQSQHLGKLGHEDPEVETSLGYRVRYCLRNNNNNKTGQPKQHRPCLNKTKPNQPTKVIQALCKNGQSVIHVCNSAERKNGDRFQNSLASQSSPSVK